MKTKLTISIETNIYKNYKKFCKQSGLVISKRIEGLIEKDMKEILIGLPKVRF